MTLENIIVGSAELTHSACFRITDSQYEAFQTLLQKIPGSQAGAMYREVFTQGIEAIKSTLGQPLTERRGE